jgi:hypothetical protein
MTDSFKIHFKIPSSLNWNYLVAKNLKTSHWIGLFDCEWFFNDKLLLEVVRVCVDSQVDFSSESWGKLRKLAEI